MSLLRSISMSPLHKRRQRRSRLGTICIDGAPDGLELKEGDGDGEEGKGMLLILLIHVISHHISTKLEIRQIP